MTIALVVLLGLAAAAWETMEPGKYRSLTMILLGFFAVRILLGRMKYRQDEKKLM
jgi:hypothetical protein